MPQFEIVSDFKMTGDQPQAVDKLVEGINKGFKQQTLLGVTGSGKTFTMANIVEKVQRPTLVMCHNKTLAAQLYSEFKEFFPNNAVEYFVSYYDYYQPEAYIPRTDTYIEKESEINEEIDKLRHAATKSLFSRRDTLIVASVSCIYGLGEPEEYRSFILTLEERVKPVSWPNFSAGWWICNTSATIWTSPGANSVSAGDTLEIQPAYEDTALRIEFFGDTIDRIVQIDPLTGEIIAINDSMDIYPGQTFRHFP